MQGFVIFMCTLVVLATVRVLWKHRSSIADALLPVRSSTVSDRSTPNTQHPTPDIMSYPSTDVFVWQWAFSVLYAQNARTERENAARRTENDRDISDGRRDAIKKMLDRHDQYVPVHEQLIKTELKAVIGGNGQKAGVLIDDLRSENAADQLARAIADPSIVVGDMEPVPA
jgi:hypothetical protein